MAIAGQPTTEAEEAEIKKWRLPRIHRGDGGDMRRLKYLRAEEKAGHRFSKWLTARKSKVEATEQTYRIINHWTELGLVDDDRKDKQTWRRFSPLDLIWIQVIVAMRRFGVPLEKIRIAKRSLFFSDFDPKDPSNNLEEFVVWAMAGKPVYLLMFDDGWTVPAMPEEIEFSRSIGVLQPHFISFSLNAIATDAIGKARGEDYSAKARDDGIAVFGLKPDEMMLLMDVRSGEYDAVRVLLKNGKIKLFKGDKVEKVDEKLIDLVKKDGYQKIEIIQENKVIQSIRRTVNRKAVAG